MKRLVCPPFRALGLVDVFEQWQHSPVITVQAATYLSCHDELVSSLVRGAKWQLQCAGVPEERIGKLLFEYNSTTHLIALEPKGVRRVDGEPVEAFFDYPDLPKRDVLIRQRRLVPGDREDALKIYGPAPAATAAQAKASA